MDARQAGDQLVLVHGAIDSVDDDAGVLQDGARIGMHLFQQQGP